MRHKCTMVVHSRPTALSVIPTICKLIINQSSFIAMGSCISLSHIFQSNTNKIHNIQSSDESNVSHQISEHWKPVETSSRKSVTMAASVTPNTLKRLETFIYYPEKEFIYEDYTQPMNTCRDGESYYCLPHHHSVITPSSTKTLTKLSSSLGKSHAISLSSRMQHLQKEEHSSYDDQVHATKDCQVVEILDYEG
jgi:hypothetical protein